MPPANVTAFNTSSTSIRVNWNQVPLGHRNGIIRRYNIRYWKTHVADKVYNLSVSSSEARMNTSENLQELFSIEITGLRKFKMYTVEVSAYTIEEGDYSRPVNISTDEDGMLD